MDAASDNTVARDLAEGAGRVLVELRLREDGPKGRSLGAIGDRSAHDFLVRQLKESRPNDPVLSEESADDPRRLSSPRAWIIDPLDGTREYAEGREDWAVHVALWERGALVAGAVALPGLGLLYGSHRPVVRPPRVGHAGLRIAVSRTRPPAIAELVGAHLGAELVPMGSAGFKVMAILRGEVDAYVHAGGQYEWDSAAPVAVAAASGLWTSRLDGQPLRYNREDPYLPDLLVSTADVAPRLLHACAAYPPEGLQAEAV